jgi:hypothetical protein
MDEVMAIAAEYGIYFAEHLLLNPEETLEMGRQGRKFAETAFSIKDVVTAHFKIY